MGPIALLGRVCFVEKGETGNVQLSTTVLGESSEDLRFLAVRPAFSHSPLSPNGSPWMTKLRSSTKYSSFVDIASQSYHEISSPVLFTVLFTATGTCQLHFLLHHFFLRPSFTGIIYESITSSPTCTTHRRWSASFTSASYAAGEERFYSQGHWGGELLLAAHGSAPVIIPIPVHQDRFDVASYAEGAVGIGLSLLQDLLDGRDTDNEKGRLVGWFRATKVNSRSYSTTIFGSPGSSVASGGASEDQEDEDETFAILGTRSLLSVSPCKGDSHYHEIEFVSNTETCFNGKKACLGA
ncbi:hypothetical protein BKA70DRAFT_1225354 [Coprinopsis sp. MPI-PUGE-AT-0042]|nr:hypothetical protein BKA70DRAFT_1225354 [Coprinopsis sp. MPI-PUGE-AT-0042]